MCRLVSCVQGEAAAARVGLNPSATTGGIAATALRLMEIGVKKTVEGTADGPTLADSPWEVR